MLLSLITIVVNIIGLATGLWLGLYVVTRSPRRGIAWLTAFSLWFLSGHFFNVLLALLPLRDRIGNAEWLIPILHLWRGSSPDRSTVWLQSWTLAPAAVLWLHATSLMRFPHLPAWRRAWLFCGYVGLVAVAGIQTNTALLLSATPGENPLYMSVLAAGPLYPLFLVLGLLFVTMSLRDLVACARAAPMPTLRSQFHLLILATLLAASVALVSIAGSGLGLRVPIVLASLQLGAGMAMMGFGVARYSALVEGRTIRSDFYHAAAGSSLVALFYVSVAWLAVSYLGFPSIATVAVATLALVTHFLVDAARYQSDAARYRRNVRQTQANLRRLARLAGDRQDMDHSLSVTLASLCSCAQATFGLILVFEDGHVRVAAAYGWPGSDLDLTPQNLTADDALHLRPCQLQPPLSEAALLIPLYGGTEQLGALILGRPLNGVSYSPDEVDQFLYPSDRLGDVIWNARRRAEYAALLTQGADVHPPETVKYPVHVSVEAVEDALRHMPNYAFLGEHPLARLKSVQARVGSNGRTHLDVGKALYGALFDGIEKLRPSSTPPSDPPTREWYPYLILHDAYVEGTPNRDIMSRLYISHGTFSRTRRAALRALARALEETEEAAA